MKHNVAGGFTLVELLVVMTIMSIAIGLVGALSVDAVAKYQRKATELYLHAILADAKKTAFVYEKELIVQTQNQQLVVFERVNVKINAYELDNVTFSANSLKIDRFGNFQQSSLRYQYEGFQGQIDLAEIK